MSIKKICKAKALMVSAVLLLGSGSLFMQTSAALSKPATENSEQRAYRQQSAQRLGVQSRRRSPELGRLGKERVRTERTRVAGRELLEPSPPAAPVKVEKQNASSKTAKKRNLLRLLLNPEVIAALGGIVGFFVSVRKRE